jgi:glycoside/pentoside/hexuronide:cation symporter, GPH family
VAGPDVSLPTGRLLAHSTMALPITASQLPLATYLPAIYATEFGLSLYVIGAIFLGERIWSTVADPLVGWLCDRTSSRFGRRKVWIAWGALLFASAYAFLFFPIFGITPFSMTAALAVLFLGWSMIIVPYYAWSGELSPDYHERTRITTYQTIMTNAALLLVLSAPAIIERYYPGNEMLKLNAMGAAVILPMIPATLLMLWSFPDKARAPARIQSGEIGLLQMLRSLSGEHTLIRIMLADFLIYVAQGARGGLFIFFAGYVLGRPEIAAALFLFQFVFGLASAPIWQAVSRRMGKHKAFLWAEGIQAAINCSLLLVGSDDLLFFLGLALIQGLAQGSGNLILRAMLADVADDYRLRTGNDRTAILFSLFSISAKAGSAVPLAIALPLIAWFGFNPQAASQPESGILALSLVFALGPGLAHLLAMVLLRKFPIDETRQREIRRELEARPGSA